MDLRVASCPSNDLALLNKVFISPEDSVQLAAQNAEYLKIGDIVYRFDKHPKIDQGSIGFNSVQRRLGQLSSGDTIHVEVFTVPTRNSALTRIAFDVDFMSKSRSSPLQLDGDQFEEGMKRRFLNHVFTVGQQFVIEHHGVNLLISVGTCETADLQALAGGDEIPDDVEAASAEFGQLLNLTSIDLGSGNANIRISGSAKSKRSKQIFVTGFNFSDMGIGGLDEQFSQIFRRAFASRIFPSAVVQKLGINHVRGLLLHGPPGTGKTLIARQIGKMLQAREPKLVNGPEILNKYVGQSEENIRNLFKEAEAEYHERGEDSDLHIIIFDEIDAICKQRGTAGGSTGVHDTVVNQLLSKMDGVDSLNNILVIGMTNRKDMIDEALLRPGRLEMHIEIGLPDSDGRVQILNIHTRKMKDNDFLDDSVDIMELAGLTKNFSGADIEGLCKSATSFAFNRQVDVNNVTKPISDDIRVTMDDFLNALEEVKPAYGVSQDDFENVVPNGIINYGSVNRELLRKGKLFIEQVRTSDRTPLLSVLFEGPPATGKTALAATLALESEFPFVKLISPDKFVGVSESYKCQQIAKVFNDAYKSPLSVIVLDNIERLIDYVASGPRFSNSVLQALMVLIKRVPPKGRKLLILATTSKRDMLDHDVEMRELFDAEVNVGRLADEDEFEAVLDHLDCFHRDDLDLAVGALRGHKIGIKRLIALIEMARAGEKTVNINEFQRCVAELAD